MDTVAQPPNVEIHTLDGMFVKQMYMIEAGTIIPQHSHAHPHLSMIAAGAVRLWRDEVLVGDFCAPHGVHIPAGTKHLFVSLVPHTVVYCIHNIDRTGAVEILEEHQVEGGTPCHLESQ